MKIRKATTKDLQFLHDSVCNLFDMYYALDNFYDSFRTKKKTNDLKKDLKKGLSEFYIAEQDKISIGFLHGIVNKKKIAFVKNVFVIESERGKGVSNQLLERFYRDSLAKKAERMELFSDIRSEAYNTWLSKGFVPYASKMKRGR